jgi:hypothetical protein
MSFGLYSQMFTSTKTDFEPNGCSSGAKQGLQVNPSRRRNTHSNPRQNFAD